MMVDRDGTVKITQIKFKDDVSINFKVEVVHGGIFPFIIISGIINGKRESLKLFLLERYVDGRPKRNEGYGLALPPRKLPKFSTERIFLDEIFLNSRGDINSIVDNLGKILTRLFALRATFHSFVGLDKITFSLNFYDFDFSYKLSSTCRLDELKKFCKE